MCWECLARTYGLQKAKGARALGLHRATLSEARDRQDGESIFAIVIKTTLVFEQAVSHY